MSNCMILEARSESIPTDEVSTPWLDYYSSKRFGILRAPNCQVMLAPISLQSMQNLILKAGDNSKGATSLSQT
jgi:hypothetical protein